MFSVVGALSSAPYILLTGAILSGGFWAYNNLVDNPAIERSAKAECTAQFNQAAAEAALAEYKRQTEVATGAIAALRADIAADREANEKAAARRSIDMEAYIERVKAEGRSCIADRADVERLRR